MPKGFYAIHSKVNLARDIFLNCRVTINLHWQMQYRQRKRIDNEKYIVAFYRNRVDWFPGSTRPTLAWAFFAGQDDDLEVALVGLDTSSELTRVCSFVIASE